MKNKDKHVSLAIKSFAVHADGSAIGKTIADLVKWSVSESKKIQSDQMQIVSKDAKNSGIER